MGVFRCRCVTNASAAAAAIIIIIIIIIIQLYAVCLQLHIRTSLFVGRMLQPFIGCNIRYM